MLTKDIPSGKVVTLGLTLWLIEVNMEQQSMFHFALAELLSRSDKSHPESAYFSSQVATGAQSDKLSC